MPQTLQTIESFVAPVVMISANGLLCLAFYNRLAVIVNRVRTINKERFDLFARLSAIAAQPQNSPEIAHFQKRSEVLDELGHQLFTRARMIRDSLVCLLVTVLLMLGCSLVLGVAPLLPSFAWLAPTLFVAGVVVMMLAVLRAIQELRIALSPLAFEHDMLERSQHENGPESLDAV
ncbi:MAG: DUF2721 domain-containing protein [Pirellulales bacterium]|nr:DUF2721 domain-containing protein [Pirellulales bacterium]